MLFSKVCRSVAFALLAASAGWSTAQAGAQPRKSASKILPPAADVNSPFAIDAPASQRADAIAFLPQDAMSTQDRQAVRDHWSLIERQAELRGFDLERGNWSDQQIACPVLPSQILLLFSRDNGARDVSEFSAVVPRGGTASVRVLPILRRGYSLFTPVAVNPLAIAYFNGVRANEHLDRKVDWLATSLCYAALTGAHIQLPPVQNGAANQTFSPATNALLQVEENGAAMIRFLDIEDPQQMKSWNSAFDKDGKLMNVSITPVSGLKTTPIP